MPIYEFRCEACQAVFEHLAMGGGDAPRCPHCGGEELARVLSTCVAQVDARPRPAQGPQARNRSCPGSGSCSELVLPGYGD